MSYEKIAQETKKLSFSEQIKLLAYLANLVKERDLNNQNQEHSKRSDFTDTYPKGFFDLFGSDPSFDLEEPEDIPVSVDGDISF